MSVLALAAGKAGAQTCAPAVPLVSVEMAPAVVARDDTLGMAELGRIQAAPAMASAADRAVFGLTETTRDARLVLGTAVEVQGHGEYCVRLQRLGVVITPKISVHVARETMRDACFGRHVLAHELRHVAVETTASPDEAAAVTARLERFAGAIPGRILRPGDSQQPWLDDLVGQIGGELQRISAEMAAARRVRHKTEVDDPESGVVLRVCGGFGRRLVDRYRRQVVAAAAPIE